ncbi:uncharacterized protein [Leptinotarsa decemlineata]|uniref:uncharacterized protein n=1 Tax=Leptinotarsa decemlineata TaxID=7539 RepID=UPI003D30BB4A
MQHVLRSFYQTRIWINSHIGHMEKHDPLQYGWQRKETLIEPCMMTYAPVPDNVRKIISLFCTEKTCSTQKCICRTEGVFCCDDCKCKARCNNIEKPDEEDN